ncbi:hypothetical protein SH2C18_06400 [Clostridium sediminicola]|uniref:MBL fold metallo-hydrolase n=1 Tax=Clostridium sediminicola TaxID=3114879 RepID=UPI0031F21EA6
MKKEKEFKNKGIKTLIFLSSIIFMFLNMAGCSTKENTQVISHDTSVTTDEVSGIMKVHFIDVAQGDAILIQSDGKNMLIDAGKNDKADLVKDYLKDQGVEKLDFFIGTHPHEDHIGGADIVLNNFEVNKVIMPKVTATTKTYKDVINSINNNNLKITVPKVGTTYELGKATFQIVAPNSTSYRDTNNYSVSIKLTLDNNSFLFTGDAEDVSEEEMVSNGMDLKVDVLKIGHHGSHSSTTNEFLNKVNPKYAVISVGKLNDYGHPHIETMEKLKDKNITVYRTDESGTIIVTSDGNTISFNIDKESLSRIEEKDNSKEPVIKEPDADSASIHQKGIEITNIDKVKEVVTIKNNLDLDVNLKGWTLVSVAGNQIYTFNDYILRAGDSITVVSGKAKGDLKWTSSNIWNNSSEDHGKLLDENGELMYFYDK